MKPSLLLCFYAEVVCYQCTFRTKIQNSVMWVRLLRDPSPNMNNLTLSLRCPATYLLSISSKTQQLYVLLYHWSFGFRMLSGTSLLSSSTFCPCLWSSFIFLWRFPTGLRLLSYSHYSGWEVVGIFDQWIVSGEVWVVWDFIDDICPSFDSKYLYTFKISIA